MDSEEIYLRDNFWDSDMKGFDKLNANFVEHSTKIVWDFVAYLEESYEAERSHHLFIKQKLSNLLKTNKHEGALSLDSLKKLEQDNEQASNLALKSLENLLNKVKQYLRNLNKHIKGESKRIQAIRGELREFFSQGKELENAIALFEKFCAEFQHFRSQDNPGIPEINKLLYYLKKLDPMVS